MEMHDFISEDLKSCYVQSDQNELCSWWCLYKALVYMVLSTCVWLFYKRILVSIVAGILFGPCILLVQTMVTSNGLLTVWFTSDYRYAWKKMVSKILGLKNNNKIIE